jgi:hypothetical protein
LVEREYLQIYKRYNETRPKVDVMADEIHLNLLTQGSYVWNQMRKMKASNLIRQKWLPYLLKISWGLGSLLMVALLITGCAHYPVNSDLKQIDPNCGYRAKFMGVQGNSPDILFYLTFSGGGTRAAAFSYGVLEELRKTEVVIDGKKRRLLDEVDVISSVSGGSFTAGYYGLFGEGIFQDFEGKVLKKNIQGALTSGTFLNPINWVRLSFATFDRSDLAAILDAFNRQIVGWSMGDTLSHGILAEALDKVFRRRKPEVGLIFHSDRGTQYASYAFRDLLDRYGFVPSMSSTGHCYDNALMESFFHTLKTELIYFEKYRTRQEARGSVFEYIEIFYNRIRKHSSLNYCSPAEFEKRTGEA